MVSYYMWEWWPAFKFIINNCQNLPVDAKEIQIGAYTQFSMIFLSFKERLGRAKSRTIYGGNPLGAD
jgi:hypothetical protein